MKHVTAGRLWTLEQMRALNEQQIKVYADHAARDITSTAVPERILGASPVYTPNRNVANPRPPGGGSFDTGSAPGNEWTVTVGGRTWTINRVRNHNAGVRMELAASDKPDDLVFEQSLVDHQVWIRQVDVADPLATISTQFVPNDNQTGIWAFIISRGVAPMPMFAGRQYRYEFYIRPIPGNPLVGTIAITLNDDAWWIWSGGEWRQLRRPDQIIRRALRPRLGVLTERIDWEHRPLTLQANGYPDALQSGAITLADHPFSARLSDRDLVRFNDHIVHIVETDKTVTVESDIRLQIAAVGKGAAGSRSRAGASGAVIVRTIDVAKGDRLRVNGVVSDVYVNDRVVFQCPGFPTAAELGVHQVPASRGYGVPGSTYREIGNDDLGFRLHRSDRTAGAGGPGAGGSNTGGQGGRPYRLDWLPGGLLLGAGGNAGRNPGLNPGTAGEPPGSGGGQTGRTASLTLDPVVRPDLFYQFDETSRTASWRVGNPPTATRFEAADEFRFMYRTFEAQDPDPTESGQRMTFAQVAGTRGRLGYTAPSPWQSLSTGSAAIPEGQNSVAFFIQARRGTDRQEPAVQPLVELAEGAEPTINAITFSYTGDSPTELAYTLHGVGVGTRAPFGWRHRYQEDQDAQTAWVPASGFAPSAPDANLLTRSITIAEDTDRVTVQAQASNPNGNTPVFSETWTRPAPGTGEPSEVAAPGQASVTLVYDTTLREAVATMDAPRATHFAVRWLFTDRDGNETPVPSAHSDGTRVYSARQPGVTRRIEVGVETAELQVWAQPWNKRLPALPDSDERNWQAGPAGTASRAFAAAGPDTVEPPPRPNITFTGYNSTARQITINWTNTLADNSRLQVVEIDDKDDERVTYPTAGTGYSDWGTATSHTHTLRADTLSVRVNLQVRNGQAGSYNIVGAQATWEVPQVVDGTVPKPGTPTFVISNAQFTTVGYRFDVTINSVRSEAVRFKVNRPGTYTLTTGGASANLSGNVYTAYSSNRAYRLSFRGSVPSSGIVITAQGRNTLTDGSANPGPEGSTTWSHYGQVTSITLSPGPLEDSPVPGAAGTITWTVTAPNARQYSFSTDQRNWTPWSSSPTYTTAVPDTANTVSVHARARQSSRYLHRQTSATWIRPTPVLPPTPPTGPQVPVPTRPTAQGIAASNLRIQVSVSGRALDVAWSAQGTGLTYGTRVRYTINGVRRGSTRFVDRGTATSFSGTIPAGVSRIEVTVRAQATFGGQNFGDAEEDTVVRDLVPFVAPPRAPTVAVSVVSQAGGNIGYQLTFTSSASATGYRFRVLRGFAVLVDWVRWDTSRTQRFTLAESVAEAGSALTVEAQARSSTDLQSVSPTTRHRFDAFAGVGTIRPTVFPIAPGQPGGEVGAWNYRVVVSAANAGEYRFRIISTTPGGPGPGVLSNWGPIAGRHLLARSAGPLDAIVYTLQARRNSRSAYRTASFTWRRTGGQEEAPPGIEYRTAPPPGGWPDGQEPPPHDPSPQGGVLPPQRQSSFSGGDPKPGLVVIRHSAPGYEFVEAN